MRKLLIANRGEIAVRIARAARERGLPTVAVYADADREAPHVLAADEAWPLPGDAPSDTYLNIGALLDVARAAGADAVHPGYGFLAENAAFARACTDAGLTFVGPTAEVIDRMGRKTTARDAAVAAGVPVVPGTERPLGPHVDDAEVQHQADAVGYPLMVKAVAGGGGKGMRTVRDAADLVAAVHRARSEALTAFGDAAVYFERRLVSPRHVEVQVLADAHGAVVPFVERECSVQRRHQKVIEESPSPSVTPALRQALADAAEAIARTVGYVNAGTIEFLVDADGAFYFLEMNTRLQVEHPVTEMVTGVDLVQWQLRLADGEPLTLTREQAMTPRGHAIECRVYAEDPDRGFLPCPGRITSLRVPSGPGVRDDSGVATGFTVPVHYDSLLSKLVAWGETRDSARRRMLRALDEYHVGGIETTLPFFRWMLQHEAFVRGAVDTTFLDAELAARADASFVEPDADTVRLAIAATAIDQWFAARDRDRSDAARGTLSGWARAARQDARRPG
jgi:acetyl-CoA carboxylase biotin carboxylase subunit